MKSFKLTNADMQQVEYKGRIADRVTITPGAAQMWDFPCALAWLPMDFHDGVIEVDVASTLSADAPDYARGFIGVGFRIDAALRFDGFYLRPLNSRCDDQVRRNHSVQYFSYPDYDFARFREEEPEKYEAYTDMQFGEWTHMKITVQGNKAVLYVNNAEQPCLIVNNLKLGGQQRGGVGFWVAVGTTGYYSNLRVTPQA